MAGWAVNLAGRLGGDRRGGVMMIFALVLVPLTAAIGLAVDGLTAMLVRAEMSRALDAAALAGARAIDAPERDSDIRKFFAANFPQGRLGANVAPLDIAVDPDSGTVRVSATATLPTRMMRLIDHDSITVAASAAAESGATRRGLELALVLDVTGSMNEIDHSDPRRDTKLNGLKRSARALLDVLYRDQETQPNLWVSVVPFAGRVNVKAPSGPADRGWMDGPVPSSWRGCLDLRYGPNAGTDAPPSIERFPDFRPNVAAHRAASACPDSPVLPLTAGRSVVQGWIDRLVAQGNTRTDVGLAWGWRAISPRWRGVWAEAPAELPLDYGLPEMDKAVVLMTDGMNTPEVTNDPDSKAATETRLASQCEAMKAEGIAIYTVLFQTPASLVPLYAACASSEEHFLVAASNEDLERAFSRIGSQLRDRYVRLIY